MTITRRSLAFCGLATVLVGCGTSAADYREMSPDDICGLVAVGEAGDLMKDVNDRQLTAKPETSVNLPGCRYGSEQGRPYLKVSIHQSSRLKAGGDVATTTVAGQQALQEDSDGSCSVFVPLEEHLYLAVIVESWDPDKDTCPVARAAAEKAYPKLTG